MNHVVRAGEAANGPFELEVTPESAGWGYSGLRVLALGAGQKEAVATGDDEYMVLSLGGSAEVVVDGTSFTLEGRADVFDGPSDVVYVPRDADLTISSTDGGRFALCTAQAERRLAPVRLPKPDVPVELRGAGIASRQVNNFGTPGVLDADRMIACEVLTPAGNWSSWPPHKHDEERDGETQLEEIYYFEARPASGSPADPAAAFGLQRVYGHAGADIDVTAEVRSGDVVLIPHGWHGPSVAAPGYDLYYLNVMAGPGAERAWLICDDPAHAWVRDTWTDQAIDERLPFGGAAR